MAIPPTYLEKLPHWQSHKIVRASKIVEITAAPSPGYAEVWRLECGVNLNASVALVARGSPRVGDFYVVCDDGYASWSPGRVFESGYTRCPASRRIHQPN